MLGQARALISIGSRPFGWNALQAIAALISLESAPAADAMYAPICSRFLTYDVTLSDAAADYCRTMMRHPYMKEWIAAAKLEPDELEELDVEF
jgi:hypothetical protein